MKKDMMNKTMKPISTEYKGTVFRSKSEAIFARCLDLAGWVTCYEPVNHNNWNSQCGHMWDFGCFNNDPRTAPHPMLYIEYKPSLPTKTYVRNLRASIHEHWIEKCREFLKAINDQENALVQCEWLINGVESPRYVLFYGSPFQTSDGNPTYTPIPLWDAVGWQSLLSVGDVSTAAAIVSELSSMDVRVDSPEPGRIRLACDSGKVPAAAIELARPHKAELIDFVSRPSNYTMESFGITDAMTQEAKSYRFDLRH